MLDQLDEAASAHDKRTVLQYTTLIALQFVNEHRIDQLRSDVAAAKSPDERARLVRETKVRTFVIAPFITNEIGSVP